MREQELALGFAWMHRRMHGMVWAAPLIGVWMIITAWVVGGDVAHPATIWSNVTCHGRSRSNRLSHNLIRTVVARGPGRSVVGAAAIAAAPDQHAGRSYLVTGARPDHLRRCRAADVVGHLTARR